MWEDVIRGLDEKTDEQLMVLYQQGEYAAFAELYARHSGRLYGYLKKRLSGPGEAEDLFQLCLLKVHQNRMRFDATLPFLPWLFSIAHNVLVDFLRKRRATPMETEALINLADRQERDSSERDGDERKTWDKILGLLPEEQKELLRLRFEEGLSFDDIARMNGTNAVSTRKRLSRTVQGIRKLFLNSVKGGRE